MGAPGHRVLVADDNAGEREDVCALLESLGESVRAVETVEEALAAIEEEEFCAFVLDQAMPLRRGAPDLLTGGDRMVRAARATDRRHTDEGGDVTPIVAFTSHSEKVSFATELFEIGITTFVAKPLCVNQAYFVEKYRGAMTRAGRGDHAKCAALAQRRTAARPKGDDTVVRLVIDGKSTTPGRTAITVNGTERDMQDSKFVVVLRSIVARERTAAGWESGLALGLGDDRGAATRVREPFKGLVPETFNVLQNDRQGNFRLNPGVVVERVEWEKLEEHPDPGVRKVAEQRKRRAGESIIGGERPRKGP